MPQTSPRTAANRSRNARVYYMDYIIFTTNSISLLRAPICALKCLFRLVPFNLISILLLFLHFVKCLQLQTCAACYRESRLFSIRYATCSGIPYSSLIVRPFLRFSRFLSNRKKKNREGSPEIVSGMCQIVKSPQVHTQVSEMRDFHELRIVIHHFSLKRIID